jgi:hypothetical protein
VLVLCTVALIRAGTDDELQRDDWRSVAEYLDDRHARALVVSPANDIRTLSFYMGRFFNLNDPGVETNVIAVIELTREPADRRNPPRSVPGFTVAEVKDEGSYRLVLLRSPRLTTVGPGLARQAAPRPEDVALVADLSR